MGVEPTLSAWKAEVIAVIPHLHIKRRVVYDACTPLARAPLYPEEGCDLVGQNSNSKNQSHASTGLWKLVAEVLSC